MYCVLSPPSVRFADSPSACTFLGPSRKRGPPKVVILAYLPHHIPFSLPTFVKGYIDAIEGRLHQTEALLALLISSGDERARGLLEDLAKASVQHLSSPTFAAWSPGKLLTLDCE